MRVLLQRVAGARVDVEGETIGEIGAGLLLLVGIGREDDASVVAPMAGKIVNLRVFPDDEGRMNRSLSETGGAVLAVSQFTLHADCRKGRRPNFLAAAPPAEGEALFDAFVTELRSLVPRVETGRFGAMMQVHLVNDGPVTIWLDSEEILKRG